MSASATVVIPEHLTPHDLVTYSRCPYEMELHRVRRLGLRSPAPVTPITPASVRPLSHSPMFSPPAGSVRVVEGRPEFLATDVLVYEDAGEPDLPMFFPPERVRPDPKFGHSGANLIDDEWGLSGRPDLVIRQTDGAVYPVEFKSTHLFLGLRDAHLTPHGRSFDVIQAIVECRLVHAVLGVRPSHGLVVYGDTQGDGGHEGWVEVRYGPAEEGWLRAAIAQVRADRERPPVPSERTCTHCTAGRDGECRYCVARPGSTPPS